MSRPSLLSGLIFCFFALSCSKNESAGSVVSSPADETNPFFVESTLPYGMPHFDLIRNEHFIPAFERGMAEELTEISAIASNPEPASFENTIVAMEQSGQLLARAQRAFSSLTSAHTNDTLKTIQTEMAPRFSSHNDSISLNANLFARVAELYGTRDTLSLDAR